MKKIAVVLLALVTVLSCFSACESIEETVSFDKVKASWDSVGFTKELSVSTYMGQPVEEAYRLSGEKDAQRGNGTRKSIIFPTRKRQRQLTRNCWEN